MRPAWKVDGPKALRSYLIDDVAVVADDEEDFVLNEIVADMRLHKELLLDGIGLGIDDIVTVRREEETVEHDMRE